MEKSTLYVLPPSPDVCQTCGVKHAEEEPHDPTSFFYKYLFSCSWSRNPTWNDAMAHCSDETQQRWKNFLQKMEIDPSSEDVRGGIKTKQDLKVRLKNAEKE